MIDKIFTEVKVIELDEGGLRAPKGTINSIPILRIAGASNSKVPGRNLLLLITLC